jgi:hypothetical protein
MSEPTSVEPSPTRTSQSDPLGPSGTRQERPRSRTLGIASLVFGILLATGATIWVIAGVLLWAS